MPRKGKELFMSMRWTITVMAAVLTAGCTNNKKETSAGGGQDSRSAMTAEPAEAGETKVSVDQTPPAVRKTIERELVGAQLEDIAKKQRNGQTIYETDIIRDGQKWEVVVAEDGRIVSKIKEGAAEENEAEAKEAGWRETFDVNKSDLQATGNNRYLTIQPGRVLRLRHGIDSLTV